jgi:hypothetical protein
VVDPRTTPAGQSQADSVTNGRDVAITAVVCLATVGLAIFLALHYADVKSVTSVLGVAAPVFAAAFGVTIGAAAGNKVGEQTGKKKGKQQLKAQMKSGLSQLESTLNAGVLEPITTRLASPAGEPHYTTENVQATFSLPHSDIAAVHDAIGHMRGLVDAED